MTRASMTTSDTNLDGGPEAIGNNFKQARKRFGAFHKGGLF